jgi:protein-disulfide isomerase
MSSTRYLFLVVGLVLSAAAAAHGQSAPDKAAEVNGHAILTADVDAKLEKELVKLQEQIFTLRKKQLDTMIDQTLLADEAAKRGISAAALVQAEVTSRVAPVTPEEITKFYDENKAKLKGELKALEEQIKTFLQTQRSQTRQQEFLQALRAAAKIEVLLTPPPILRFEVRTAGAPVRGSVNAPVTIVEFSDFHCPFCKKVQPVLEEVRAKYGDKIKIVYRDFPLDALHPQARAASEAAGCAHEQGKFWEFHDLIFKSGSDASPATLNRFADSIGMDLTAFEACRTSGKYKTPVQASTVEGAKLGITGTPTFFVNGRMLVGAQPLSAFTRVIEEELALSQARQSGENR